MNIKEAKELRSHKVVIDPALDLHILKRLDNTGILARILDKVHHNNLNDTMDVLEIVFKGVSR